MLTNDDELAQLMDSIRVHGKAVAVDLKDRTFDHDPKYLNMRIGLNSRLDTIQAAVLIEKLKVFGQEIEWRNAAAARYNDGLRPRTSPRSRTCRPATSPTGRNIRSSIRTATP